MSDGYGLVYSKVEQMVLGYRSTVDSPGNPYFSSNTLEKNVGTAPKAVLVTNSSATGVSFNAYFFDSVAAGITNHLFFSENIRNGITTGAQRWTIFSQSVGFPGHPATPYSPIRMPDGSTNGVRLITRANPPNDSAGIYQPLTPTSVFENGKVYTFSVWIAGDSGGGVYPENTTARLSYYSNTQAKSIYTEDLVVGPVPKRYSITFVAKESASQSSENIAIGNGISTKGVTAQLVLWGAQVNEGNTAGPYIPTSTQWNGLGTGVGNTSVVYQPQNNPDIRNILVVNITAPANTSFILTNSFFAFSTNNTISTAPPSGFSVYGLF